MDYPARGKWKVVINEKLPFTEISRADVAAFMLQNLTDKTFSELTPSIAWEHA